MYLREQARARAYVCVVGARMRVNLCVRARVLRGGGGGGREKEVRACVRVLVRVLCDCFLLGAWRGHTGYSPHDRSVHLQG